LLSLVGSEPDQATTAYLKVIATEAEAADRTPAS
jgi:hypothetical protein